MTDLGSREADEPTSEPDRHDREVARPPIGAAFPLPSPLAARLMAWAIGPAHDPALGDEGTDEVARRVLVVEDDRASRSALRRLFAARGWVVAEAATLAEGFAALEPPPRWVVLDLMLPDGDGADLLRWVRANGLPTRIVVATGVADEARIEEVVGLGPDSLLHKPIDINTLFRVCDG